jgi:hypothetical protein
VRTFYEGATQIEWVLDVVAAARASALRKADVAHAAGRIEYDQASRHKSTDGPTSEGLRQNKDPAVDSNWLQRTTLLLQQKDPVAGQVAM